MTAPELIPDEVDDDYYDPSGDEGKAPYYEDDDSPLLEVDEEATAALNGRYRWDGNALQRRNTKPQSA